MIFHVIYNLIISINRIETCYCNRRGVKPLAYSKCGRRVLLGHCNQLLLFGLEKQSILNAAPQNFSAERPNLDMLLQSQVSAWMVSETAKITTKAD